MSIKTIECHDCDSEIKIKDMYDEYDNDDICFCPLCGGDNIIVNGGNK